MAYFQIDEEIIFMSKKKRLVNFLTRMVRYSKKIIIVKLFTK